MVKSHLTNIVGVVYYFKYVGEVPLGLLFFCSNLPSVMGGFFMEKMMIPDNYKPIRQVGNGKTVSFSFDFPMLSENFIKVYREQDGVQELVDPSEYVWGYIPVEGEDAPVEDIAPENVITFYEAPADGVVIVIAREIPLEQTTPYKTSSGFPAVRVEDNFDKLTAITQQLMEEVDRCVKVEITNDQTSEELLAEVYGKLDSATEVAQEAVDAAKSATEAVASAEKTLADVTTYVDTSKTEIDALITKTTDEIDKTIAEATEEIKDAAVAEAETAIAAGVKVIEDTATEATGVISTKTAEFETLVQESTKDLEGNVEKARIWAEGEQAEVEPLGGSLSSKGWALQASNSATSASQSAAQAKTSETNAKSYADSIEPDRFLSKGTITNCITEIPQDIKLELNDGVLTLKAGSKVYVPNGFEEDGTTPKFDVVVIESDLTRTTSSTGSGSAFLYYNANDKSLSILTTTADSKAYNYSGTAAPTSFLSGYAFWFDTENNLIKYTSNSGSTWISYHSFPLGIVSYGSSAFASIDQVFNGFGYIGSTVFALPNVKGLIPDGRNADGSLRNIEYVTDKVGMQHLVNNEVGYFSLNVWSDGTVAGTNAKYDSTLNKIIGSSRGTNCFEVGQFYVSSGVITSFTPKLPFRAVDYSDKENIIGWGMPDYTAGVDKSVGVTYTAEVNGYILFNMHSKVSSNVLKINGNISVNLTTQGTYAHGVAIMMPISAGDTYLLSGQKSLFVFYPCKGVN